MSKSQQKCQNFTPAFRLIYLISHRHLGDY